MLADFLREEVDTGCAHSAAINVDEGDRVFTLEPYGSRSADPTMHRQLAKSAGPIGWWGWVQENDDPNATPGGREDARLAALPLTYPEVGGSAGDLPPGYRHIAVERTLGTGRGRFETVVERLMTWDMHRRAGLLVDHTPPAVTIGQVAVVSILLLGQLPIGAPVRVVAVDDHPACRASPTAPCGAILNQARNGSSSITTPTTPCAPPSAPSPDPHAGTPGGAPLARQLQDRTTNRYLDALAATS